MWNKWWSGPRQLRLVFLAVMILLASTLGCVTWWLLEQDQQLATQRLGERQDTAADLTVAALQKRLLSVEQELSRALAGSEPRTTMPASGAIVVQLISGSIRVWPDNGLVYYPVVQEVPKDGTFAFPKVVPGSYVLLARLGNESFANASVELRERDVKEISVTLTPAFNLPGRIRIENASPAPDITSLVAVLVREPAAGGRGVLTATKFGGFADLPIEVRNVSADGSFTVMNVPPGDYRIALAGNTLTPGSATQAAYVKAMRLGDADILDRVVHFDGPPEGALEIVIGNGTGSLEGRAMMDPQQPASASIVVLLPDPGRRFRTDLYKTTVTDASGRFRVDGIPPGDYSAFVWTEVEPGAWQDPDFMRRLEDRGKSVHISEGAREKYGTRGHRTKTVKKPIAPC